MIAVFVKEFRSFLNSLIAYLVMIVFLTAMGLLVWVFPDTSVLDYGFADLLTLFSLAPYVFIFLIPAITMRSFAEERRNGTLDLLFTKPVSEWQIIFGKYLASLTLVFITLVPTVIYYFSISALGNPTNNIDTSAVIGSYVGLFLLSSVFCAIGILASSITTNQIVAFIIAAFFSYIFFSGFHAAAALASSASISLLIKQTGILYHYETLSRGLIDSRDVLYLVSLSFFMLLITKTILSSRSW